jgi:hypothetical protein
MSSEEIKSLGFSATHKTDSMSGYTYYEYMKKNVNVAYTIVDSAGQKDVYTIYVGSIIDFVRNLALGQVIFRGKIETLDELKVLLRQLGVNE